MLEQHLKNREKWSGCNGEKERHRGERVAIAEGEEEEETGQRQNGKEKGEAAKEGCGDGWERGGAHKEHKVVEVYSEKMEKTGREKVEEESEDINEYGIVPQIFPAAPANLQGVHAIFKHCVFV
ncbi:hypothetical protein HispidOSU_006894 [Sigmodon hispidus]